MRATVIAFVLLALLPASASAVGGLPKFKGNTIVPGKSIAGVRVGMKADTAIAGWGGNAACPKPFAWGSCTWTAGTRDQVDLLVVDGRVVNISVRIRTDSKGAPVFKGSLMKLKTSRKVGLGMTLRTILRRYPKLRGSPSGAAIGSGSHTTTFSTSGGRVSEISIGAAL